MWVVLLSRPHLARCCLLLPPSGWWCFPLPAPLGGAVWFFLGLVSSHCFGDTPHLSLAIYLASLNPALLNLHPLHSSARDPSRKPKNLARAERNLKKYKHETRSWQWQWQWQWHAQRSPTLVNEGLALQARASGPWPHQKRSVLTVKLALLARCRNHSVMDRESCTEVNPMFTAEKNMKQGVRKEYSPQERKHRRENGKHQQEHRRENGRHRRVSFLRISIPKSPLRRGQFCRHVPEPRGYSTTVFFSFFESGIFETGIFPGGGCRNLLFSRWPGISRWEGVRDGFFWARVFFETGVFRAWGFSRRVFFDHSPKWLLLCHLRGDGWQEPRHIVPNRDIPFWEHLHTWQTRTELFPCCGCLATGRTRVHALLSSMSHSNSKSEVPALDRANILNIPSEKPDYHAQHLTSFQVARTLLQTIVAHPKPQKLKIWKQWKTNQRNREKNPAFELNRFPLEVETI